MNRFAVAIIVCALSLTLTGCSSATASNSNVSSSGLSAASSQASSSGASSDRTRGTADTVFGYPKQLEVSSGSGSDIGTVGIFYAQSSECTDENLEKWFNQYVRWGLDNWCVVMYSDQPGFGVYANVTYAEANVSIDSDFMLADDSDSVLYVFSSDDAFSDGKLVRQE